MNKALVLGRLGQDPELKYTPGGQAVCNFSLATSKKWTNKEGVKQEKTEWHSIVVWGKLAELCNQYLAKGRQALVTGEMQTRSWDDKDGKKCYKTEVLALEVEFIGGAPSASGGGNAAPGNNTTTNNEYQISNDAHFASDDIPF